MSETMDAKLKGLPDHRILELEARIEQIISTDESRAATVGILRSVPGIGPVASTMLIAPDLRRVNCRAHRPCSNRKRSLQKAPEMDTPYCLKDTVARIFR